MFDCFDPMTVGVLANPDMVSGMSAMGLGGGMGGGGQGGGGGGGFTGPMNIGMGMVKSGLDVYNTIDSIIMRHRNANEQRRQFDQTFDENVRQFGLNYALRDFATRQGVSLAKAKQLYEAETLALNKQTTAENLRTSALGRQMSATKFAWEKEDRAKQQKRAKAMQKGIVTGLFGGA